MDRAKANKTLEAGETDQIIAEEFERLRESQLFLRSPVLSRLLQYLVEHRLRGGRSAPKAYAIATEALGRNADFDPAVDSYPRVMVGRLRNLLDRYYAETPWVHRLRVPQGSYEIVVQHRTAPPARSAAVTPGVGEDAAAAEAGGAGVTSTRHPGVGAPSSRARWWTVLVIVAVAMLAGGWWLAGNWQRMFAPSAVPPPLLEIALPQSGSTPVSRALARALDGRLRDGLRRFDLVDLRSTASASKPDTMQRADYRLDVSLVRTLAGPADVTLVLNRVSDQRTIWSQQFHLTQDQMPGFEAIDPAIAQIAGDYGVIVRDQLARQPENFAPGYPCLAQFNRLRQLRDKDTAKKVDACLRATIFRDPRNAAALAALSLVRFGDWQPLRGTPAGDKAYAEAVSLAQRAYDSGAETAAATFAMARAQYYAGNCRGGVGIGDAAVRLNPYDADTAGFQGVFKIACDQPVEGIALLERSLALDASAPGVPAVTLAFVYSQQGRQDDALAVLDHMPSPSTMEPQYTMVRAIVFARQGKVDEARGLWRHLLDYTRQPQDAPPEKVLRQFMINPEVIRRASKALRESGVVAPQPVAR